MICRFCGNKINDDDARGLQGILKCQSCGKYNYYYREILYTEGGERYIGECKNGSKSSKSGKITLALCFFLGLIGVHYIYLGRYWRAVAYLLTLGGFGTFWVVDMFCLFLSGLKDANGRWVTL